MPFKRIKIQLDSLPGESAHLEMIPYRILSSPFQIDEKNAKQSAVLCLLKQVNNQLYVLLIERQSDGGKHSGQIAFPGGKKDEEDNGLEQTALRETFEEVGIEAHNVEILGELTSVYIPVSNFFVQPFIGVLKQEYNLVLSAREVKEAFWFNVKELLNEDCKTKRHIKNHKGITLKDIPCFVLNDKVVWGATSLILNELKQLLINLGLK
jgi:8-oxo-dGTP pyrophosphatase MutT (NUDIX family)